MLERWTHLLRVASLEHLMRFSLAAQILVATALLGVGERSGTLTAVTIVTLLISTYLTDKLGVFHLKQPIADLVALGVMLITGINAYYVDRHGQLLAVADLQSYLQYVLLFQRKTSRVYWQLALLSLGQVAIASTLVPGPLFGVLLLVYLFLGLVTFSLLLIFNESRRYAAAEQLLAATALAAPGVSAPAMAWNQAPQLIGKSAPTEPLRALRGLAEQAAWICLVTLVVAVPLFLFLPRWNVPNREATATDPLRSVGFSKKVTLGELGEVVNNPDLVMRISFYHNHDSRPFRLAGEPLLRGTVVTQYENGVWNQAHSSIPVQIPQPQDTYKDFVRQRITAEPLDVPELFCIFPMFSLSPDSRLRTSARADQLLRQEDSRTSRMDFEIGTIGIEGDRQREFTPHYMGLGAGERAHLLRMSGDDPSRGDRFSGLRATASRVLAEANIDPEDRLAAARELNDYLRTSRQFSYTLEGLPRDPALDPLEDFVTKNRRGHCEYFAGALVMMLRSQGIPARMAIGFKGGEWNAPGMYYQIQQLHAHTWVEAFLDREDLPDGLVDSYEKSPRGAWLTLDPTASNEFGEQDSGNVGLVSRVRQYVDLARVIWNNYVVGLSARRQQAEIYEPLAVGVDQTIETIVSPQAWTERFHRIGESPLGTFWQWYRRHWFSWRGGLVAAGFSLLLVVVYFATRWLLLTLRRLGLVGKASDAGHAPVLEMYRRLEAVLNKHGFERQPAQTAYEFAVAAGGDLSQRIEHKGLAHLPRSVIEAFYRVRFGGHTLDKPEADAVEHALAELETSLARRK